MRASWRGWRTQAVRGAAHHVILFVNVVELDVFVSCASEVSDFRDLAVRVLKAIERSVVYGLQTSVVIRNWDYREEPPEVVRPGAFSARSLRMVDSSSAVVGILGTTVGRVTSQELTRAIERYARGEADNVWLFLVAGSKGAPHNRLLRQIRRKTHMQVVYQEFGDALDFEEKLFVALIPYVVRKAILDRETVIPPATGFA